MKMNEDRLFPRSRAIVMVAAVAVSWMSAPAHAVLLEWVTVGNAGNPADTTGYGAVGYDYRIGLYEVTIGQYSRFLNAVAATDTYSLYNPSMASNLNVIAIERLGSPGAYTYSVLDSAAVSGDRPITYVSWFDAARFANWMHNGQPTGAQGSGTTETGAYTLAGATSGTAPARNGGANFFIPTENEWYKAAYYTGTGGVYTAYATNSNSVPGNVIGQDENQANYAAGTFSVTQEASFDPSQNYLTDVGAFPFSPSAYGTYDQSGNVNEWNDLDGTAGTTRGLRGGNWDSGPFMSLLPSSERGMSAPSDGGQLVGFRLASPVPVPEPSTWLMGMAGLAWGAWAMFRRRRAGLGQRGTAAGAAREQGISIKGAKLASRSLGVVCVAAMLCVTEVPAHAVTILTTPVGNAGNANDTTGFGGVDYEYRIGTTEVTNAQYAAFLNAKAASDPLGLYSANMGSNARGGITRSGSSGSYTYATKANMGNKPVNFVTWYDSIRFANWLNNGQGTGDTEIGAYTLLGGTATPSNGNGITRNPDAIWFMPSENEWYKAAYHQPQVQGGDTDDYWLYPTATNAAPTVATANATGDISNPGVNVANYNFGADWNSLNANLTTVGSAGVDSRSFYGTSDQGGNLWEWNEDLDSVSFRGARGTSFDDLVAGMQSSSRSNDEPTHQNFFIGFRVATVPEPSTAVLCIAGGVAAWVLRRRFR